MGLSALEGHRLLSEASLEGAEGFAVNGGTVAWISQRSPDKETPNEDSALIAPLGESGVLLAVADGAGGMPAGQVASKLALERLLAAVLAGDPREALRGAVLDGFEQANDAILATRSGSGTTLAVAAIYDGKLRTYHVGDSQILVTGQRGSLKLQTIMHSPVGYALESELLNEAEAASHEERHVVSNLMGSLDMRIEIGPEIKLARFDTVLLASDGLADNLLSDAIVETIKSGPLHRQLDALARQCRAAMNGGAENAHPDDLTLLAWRRGR